MELEESNKPQEKENPVTAMQPQRGMLQGKTNPTRRTAVVAVHNRPREIPKKKGNQNAKKSKQLNWKWKE
jgi:hypothetical protein